MGPWTVAGAVKLEIEKKIFLLIQIHSGLEWIESFAAKQEQFRVGVNCSKFNCSTVICLTLLAGNQLLDTKFINCSNPVNPGETGFEQLIKKVSFAW